MSEFLTLDDPAYFEGLARVEAQHWWSLGMWRLANLWLDRALPGRRGLRALDAGCGAGMTVVRLARRPEIHETIAMDPSLAALEHARGRHATNLLRGSLINLPFPEASIDLVTCFDVLQQLPPTGDHVAAAEIHRVLRPGGWALLRTNGKGGWRDDGGSPVPYDPRSLSALLIDAGLRIRRRSYANCLPALAQEWRGRLLRCDGSNRGGHPAGKGLAIDVPSPWINRVMGAVSGAEAIVAGRWGLPLPFGHSTLVLAQKPQAEARHENWN